MARRAAGDLATRLAVEGRVFYASDADQNDKVTGQTSFATTTPTFLLRNPSTSGVICIPLYITLNQSGSVAGGDIDIIVEIDDADRFASGGTTETVLSSRPKKGRTNACTLLTGATASDAYGVRIDGITIAPDVSPAEGALQQYLWTPTSTMDILDPASSLLVYTYAASTGPTWWWTVKWGEVPTNLENVYFGYTNK